MESDNSAQSSDDSGFSRSPRSPDKPESSTFLRLKDGSVFAVWGAHSSLSSLVSSEKLPEGSELVAVEPGEKGETSQKQVEQEKYSLGREIGRGGMGAIIEARDNDLRRIIAMKVMLSGPNAPLYEYERFLKEAQVTGLLEHPNIVPVHELGVDKNSRPFFTMKLVGGESLQSILHKISSSDEKYLEKYPLTRLLTIFVQVCNAVSFAHSRGVIHRDLKPENILVGDFGEVLVMDWGLAKIKNVREMLSYKEIPTDVDCTRTLEGSVIGTPAYMPPEQAIGDTAATDKRSDVFSLGAVLYEIVTGNKPYSGDSIIEVLSKASRGDFVDARRIPTVPRELARICMRAMEKRQENRYATTSAMATDVEAFIDNRVIPAYSLKPWQKIVQSLGVLALFVVLVPIVSFSGFSQVLQYLNLASVIFVLGCGLLYQLSIVGGKLSLMGRIRPKNRSVAQSAGSLKLQEGILLGGVLGTFIGFIAVSAFVSDPSTIGRGMAAALITVFYIYPLFLILRLAYIRDVRANSLFGLISPSRPSVLLEMAFLFSIPYLPVVIIAVGRTDPGLGNFIAFAVPGISLGHVVSYTVYILIITFITTLLYLRLIFTFQELWAAVGHFFAFLAGGEVSIENKVHDSSVIRFLFETFLIFDLSVCMLFYIGMLFRAETEGELGNSLLVVCMASSFGFLLYVLLNYVLMRRFAGDGGYARSAHALENETFQFYRKHYGALWSDTVGGKATAVICSFGMVLLSIGGFVLSGGSLFRPHVMQSYFSSAGVTISVLGIGIVILSGIQRIRKRCRFEKASKDSMV